MGQVSAALIPFLFFRLRVFASLCFCRFLDTSGGEGLGMARARDRDLARTQAPLQGKDEDMGSLGTDS